jgi:hypothetical protein
MVLSTHAGRYNYRAEEMGLDDGETHQLPCADDMAIGIMSQPRHHHKTASN